MTLTGRMKGVVYGPHSRRCFCCSKVALYRGSMTIATEENCPPTPKLAPNQTLTLTGEQFLLGAIVSLPHNPKTNPNLDQTPTLTGGQISSGEWGRGAVGRIPSIGVRIKRYFDNKTRRNQAGGAASPQISAKLSLWKI